MSTKTYVEVCGERCRGCRMLIPRIDPTPGTPRHMHRFEYAISMDDDFPCTAPTELEYANEHIEELTARLEAAEADTARLDWLADECLSGRVGNGIAFMPTTNIHTSAVAWYLCDLGDEDPDGDLAASEPSIRAAIDAARLGGGK